MTTYAPYNFVPFPEQYVIRYSSSDELPTHDASDQQPHLLSGEIEFRLKALTPILIAAGKDRDQALSKEREFFCDEQGRPQIPGSTIRGWLRQTTAVLSLSNWTKAIEDETFFYRHVVGSGVKGEKRYKQILDIQSIKTKDGKGYSIARNVKAGYLVYDETKGYVIYPAITLGETTNSSTYLKCSSKQYPGLQQKIERGFMTEWMRYNLDKKGRVVSLDKSTGKFKGTLLYSGFIKNGSIEKQTAYLIHAMDPVADPVAIPDADIKLYQADYKYRCSKFGKSDRRVDFFKLPEQPGKGSAKPCFYIEYGGRLYFGFTAFLRLPYAHSTLEGIPGKDSEGIDYASSLFGFAPKDEKSGGYASRISCRNAPVEEAGLAKQGQAVKMVLGQPKASAEANYLLHDDVHTLTASYNTRGFKLRGLKQYWLSDQVRAPEIATEKEDANFIQHLKFLEAGCSFKVTIGFDRLHTDELGLLLYALTAPENHQLGMAKAYGYGRVQVADLHLSHVHSRMRYRLTDFFNWCERNDGTNDANVADYVNDYKEYMRNHKNTNIDQQASARMFLAMKKLAVPGPLTLDKLKFPSLKEYSQKKNPLPTVETIIRGTATDGRSPSQTNRNPMSSSIRHPRAGASPGADQRSSGHHPGKRPTSNRNEGKGANWGELTSMSEAFLKAEKNQNNGTKQTRDNGKKK
jgi:CRISPR-associated protein (TIGR03986 family)